MCKPIVLACTLAVLVTALAHAEGLRLLFRADLDGTLGPQVGVGEVATEGRPAFAPGRHGQAFVADGTCVLTYPAPGHLDKARGTVAMWVSPIWDGADGQNHSFFSDDIDFNREAENNLHLWKWLLGDVLRFDIRTEHPQDIEFGVGGWKAGEWHHIAAAWDCEAGTWLFADGRLVASLALQWQPKQGTRFFVGANWGGGSPAQALIQDVRIYSGPLEAGQVARVSAGKDLPVLTPIRITAPQAIAVGRPFPVQLTCQAEEATEDGLPLSVSLDGLALPCAEASAEVKLRRGAATYGPLHFSLPAYYHTVPGRHELVATLAGAILTKAEPWQLSVEVTPRPRKAGPTMWRFVDRKVLRGADVYLAPGPDVAFWFDGAVRPYDEVGQKLCEQVVASGRIVDVIPCRLVDEVGCAATDHGFREWGTSHVATLADGRQYRITGSRESVTDQKQVYGSTTRVVPGFQYRLASVPRPVPHLLVVDTINDRERYVETAIDVAPGSAIAPVLAASGPGSQDLINLNVTYTGREYALDGQPFQQVTLFYPKSDAVTATVTDSRRELQQDEGTGAAVSRLAVYEITTDLADIPANVPDSERTVSLFYPWVGPLYNEYGFCATTEGTRRASIDTLTDYLRFMGFNRLEFHPYEFSRAAEFQSELFPHPAKGDVFEDTLPITRAKGIEVVPRIDSMVFYLSDEAGKNLYAEQEAYQLTRQGETMRFFGVVPDPLHPQVQELLQDMLCELAAKTKGWPNVPAVGFRANGKFGSLYVGTDRAHPPEESGYSEFDVRAFEKDCGVTVGGTAGNAQSRHDWLKANAWDQWIEWRCRRIHDHWVRLAEAVRAVDPGKQLIVFTKIPANDPGEKRDWEKAPVDLLALHKYHGYDPALYADDGDLILSRVMGIDADRYWSPSWNKLFFFQPPIGGFFRSAEPSGVELYYIYWELPDHPLGFRVGPGSPRGRAYFEPMTHALRYQNPGSFCFYNWFRATMGHETDLREFCRAFRGLPMVDPQPFAGRIEPAEAAADERLCVRMYRDRIGIVNDCGEARDITLVLPQDYARKGLHDLALSTSCEIATHDGTREVRLHLRPWDVRTLAP
ncbi:MAG: LamG domain-containing protein [Armatimonadetes bacterium]|nr:LamG domain-containing protein [Armatimonadota bacterium]